jgi:hypothetical protein
MLAVLSKSKGILVCRAVFIWVFILVQRLKMSDCLGQTFKFQTASVLIADCLLDWPIVSLGGGAEK